MLLSGDSWSYMEFEEFKWCENQVISWTCLAIAVP